jgi:hypothetical protein
MNDVHFFIQGLFTILNQVSDVLLILAPPFRPVFSKKVDPESFAIAEKRERNLSKLTSFYFLMIALIQSSCTS